LFAGRAAAGGLGEGNLMALGQPDELRLPIKSKTRLTLA
jgi:hypothetical protein